MPVLLQQQEKRKNLKNEAPLPKSLGLQLHVYVSVYMWHVDEKITRYLEYLALGFYLYLEEINQDIA